MDNSGYYTLKLKTVYPLYVAKAERKGRTREEVNQIITWLTGYTEKALNGILNTDTDFETFFRNAPSFNPSAALITGVICGYRVEEIKDPIVQKVRYLDKLIDELAKGKSMNKILRA